jgi:hypothetical protein
VTVLQGREAVAVVLLCIVIISGADQLGLQKMDHGRQHLFARQSAQGHVLPDLLSDGGQCLGEGNDMLVLRAFSHLTEARVVELVINLKARSASIYPCILMRRRFHHPTRQSRDGLAARGARAFRADKGLVKERPPAFIENSNTKTSAI